MEIIQEETKDFSSENGEIEAEEEFKNYTQIMNEYFTKIIN